MKFVKWKGEVNTSVYSELYLTIELICKRSQLNQINSTLGNVFSSFLNSTC